MEIITFIFGITGVLLVSGTCIFVIYNAYKAEKKTYCKKR